MRSQALRGTSVVVVDDDVDSAELLGMLLEGQGAEVRTLHTGASTIDLLASVKPQVLLLDISLPDMDGYELLSRIHRIPGLEHVPAVAVTGHANERDRARALAAGFAVHTVKPFDTEALIHLIASLGAPGNDAAPASALVSAVDALDGILQRDGLVAALRALNARSSHRFTGLYRYDGPMLRNVALIDRNDPESAKGGDVPIETSYCSLVARDRAPFATEDGSKDARVAGLPLRPDVLAYCGSLVRNADGTPFGSLCHFDLEPRPVVAAEVALLEGFAPRLARAVATDAF